MYMTIHQQMIEIMHKYYTNIKIGGFDFQVDNIPKKKIENASKKFAFGLDEKSIIGFYDTTVLGSGKGGYIFTDSKIYYLETFSKPKKLWYDDIKKVEITDNYKDKDCDKTLQFELLDGTTLSWSDTYLNKTPLLNFFNDVLNIMQQGSSFNKASIPYEAKKEAGALAGGITFGNFQTTNKLYNEEKFHARQGHGFAAEQANTLYDNLTGHKARVVGDNNAINGADRILDGIEIQSKYCATGSRCINECFADDGKGAFRYYTNNGKPMAIEVPSDKYEAAVSAMEEKIRRGQVKGITDPSEAKNIVKKGHFTYEQAKNIAKAGTVESLTYDAINGVIISASSFGISAVVSFATSMWNGDDFDIALKNAATSGIRVGGTTFITTVLASQLSKAGLNSALVGSSEAIVRLMGPKASAILANAFRSGTNIYGAAAMKSAARLLRGNVITASVSVVVLSTFDIADILRGRISGKQLFKNLTNTTSSVAGGTAGWVGGAAIGSAIFPGVGTVVGGLIGSIGAGMLANKASDAILSNIVEDDADELVRIIEKEFSNLALDYLLTQKEAEKVADALRDMLNGKLLKDMFASNNKSNFARDLLIPLIESEVSKREKIFLPTNEQFIYEIKNILEEIPDIELQET